MEFELGTIVRRKAQPSVVGRIRNKYFEEATQEWIYRVQFGNSVRGVSESELELLPDDVDPWDDVRSVRFGNADDFVNLLTYERLRKPPARIAASFGSAKAAFYPYQFKPLLKFLENPRQRLLIADDVGLGKTIEAGYVLRELKSRTDVDRILLVVPSRLRSKWRDEMWRRFNEKFDIVSAKELLELRDQMTRGVEEPFNWIVSLESARSEAVVQFLSELQPIVDLVVVDEAHRMRNQPTLQHKLGAALSRCADSMVMLTATPVQTSLENLFRLLNILDPAEFSNAELFEHQSEANRPIIEAARCIRKHPPESNEAVELLEGLEKSRFTRELTKSRFFTSVLSRCRNAGSLNREELVALQRDINELSLTGGIVSRTRKVDVLTNRVVRRANTVRFNYSNHERAFYDSVAELCRVLRPDLSGWGEAMATLQAYRATASCIPAAAATFRAKLRAGTQFWKGLSEEIEGDAQSDSSNSLKSLYGERGASVKAKLDEVESTLGNLQQEDTKFDFLIEKLTSVWKEDEANGTPLRKVVLFSFFKATLRYLHERLLDKELECRLISGDVPMGERELRIEEFAARSDVLVLLSSEVGSEGLDLQFASVIVNYDLPWNPMAVEQRIGRLDRIGQASPAILIMNMTAADTIEDRILLRLYDRIGIFKESIGDLDSILGDRVEDIAARVLLGDLDEVEAENQAKETADALLDQRLKAEHLSTNSGALMAADQSFLDEIQGLVGRRKIPSGEELHAYVGHYLSTQFIGSVFPESLKTKVDKIHLPPEGAHEMVTRLSGDQEAERLGRRLAGGPVDATFDQDEALKHARAELVHSRHPLVRLVSASFDSRRNELIRSFALSLSAGDLLDGARGLSGDIAFAIYSFELEGVRRSVTLVPVFVKEEGVLDREKSEDLFLSMLCGASTLDPSPEVADDVVDYLSGRLDQEVMRVRSSVLDEQQTLNTVRHERFKLTKTIALDRRVEMAKARLDALVENAAAEFAVKMARSRYEKEQRIRETELKSLADIAQTKLEDELVAVGFLQVG